MPQPKKRKGRKASKAKPKTPAEEAARNIVGGIVVALVQNPNGQGQALQVEPINGTKIREIPTLLRQGANHVEKQLVGE